jgi:hypothetical protein
MSVTKAISILVVLLMTSGFFTGCIKYDYNERAAQFPEKYFGTQPGYHLLSEHFAVEVNERLMKFYHLDKSTHKKALLGIVTTFWGDFANYGQREVAYAISEDGKRLLFFDEPGVGEGKPIPMKIGVFVADLYLMDVDNAQKQLLYSDVHRLGTSCVDLPKNYIRYGKISAVGNIEKIAYSTESKEVFLEARRKMLWDSGEKDKICGPLDVL